ncbi:MAG: PilZ domain-containing protein [Deltaproteobacteria bacterium]|nr:PilZ domain-containing protein [Deltaproteobacteria bacterium]
MAPDAHKIEAAKPAQMAREILGEALGQIQDIRSGGLDLEVITTSIAKAVRALFAVQSSQPDERAHVAGVCEAMDHLRHTLALLQDVRSNEPAVLGAASTIARALAILYPVSKVQERQGGAPGSPASIIRGPVADDARRHEKRLAIEADIGFQSDTNFFTGFSEDISSGGLFIASYDLRPIGATMNINFTLPDGHLVSVTGVVRWIREYTELHPDMAPGMGVQFQGLKHEDERAINRFLTQRPPMFFEE